MKLNFASIIVFSCILCSCSDEPEERSGLIDTDPLYAFGVLLKERIDSSTVYTDSLLKEKIMSVEDEVGSKYNMFKVLRVDSNSYKIVASPLNFSKNREPFYLITEDSVYILTAKSIKKKE
ncbi:hypothetical protein ACFS7Z_21905 [Pontibacter toksunensis]|uniref:Lipoprotein n=1 Tax=Pontibacter toksunensis TaxID=1332631 RepID=A0ABW6BZ08_9BACT